MNSSLALGWLRGGLLLTQVKHELASGLLLALPSLLSLAGLPSVSSSSSLSVQTASHHLVCL